MRRIKAVFLLLASGIAASGVAQEYAAKITVNSGNSFVVKRLNIQGDRLFQESGQSSTALSMIKEIEFRFSGIGLPMCEKMFASGDRKALEDLLEMNVGPVVQYVNLPTNLGDYLVWLMKAQYWNENRSGMAATISRIRQANNPEQIAVASMYFSVLLLDQGKLENAKTVFASVENPDAVSESMAEYIRGRIALEEGESREAMQHVARIIAFHGRDPEWMPPATVLEARVYQQLGQPQKAEAVANELMIAYPGTRWSKTGEAIKMESNGTRGG